MKTILGKVRFKSSIVHVRNCLLSVEDDRLDCERVGLGIAYRGRTAPSPRGFSMRSADEFWGHDCGASQLVAKAALACADFSEQLKAQITQGERDHDAARGDHVYSHGLSCSASA